MSEKEASATGSAASTHSSVGRFWPRAVLLYLPGCLLGLLALGVLADQLLVVEFQQDDAGLVEHLAAPEGVALGPGGGHVYVASKSEDALTAFHREPDYGTLSLCQALVDDVDGVFGLDGASAVSTAPDGRHVYTVSAFDHSLVVFRRDATADALVFLPAQAKENYVGGVEGLGNPADVAVSGDDQNVFVAATFPSALSVFRRDASTDDLTFVEAELDGAGGVDGLGGASAVAVSPDGAHVYVTGRADESLVVFERVGGGVSHLATYADADAGVEGLLGASGVAVSPDGAHVYAVGSTFGSLAAFARDAADGTLEFVEAHFDGVDGIDGLGGAEDVAVSPDGSRVVVAAPGDDAVTLFRRDPATGRLAFLDSRATPGAAAGLSGARSLAYSPDAAHVYVASRADDALAGLSVALCEGDESTGDSDSDAFCDDVDLCLGDDLSGDDDVDGVCDDLDACPGFDDAADADGDGVADGCDVCFGDDAEGDSDGDGTCDDLDLCAGFPDQQDDDGDGVPDGCDVCTGDDATGDDDGDGVCDDVDLCPGFDDSEDADMDGLIDGCELCLGDNASGDSDGDGVCDDSDCAVDDAAAAVIDRCGVCGGDGTSCPLFVDGFESGDFDAWTSVLGDPI